ncbi:C4-dicarboxylate-binding periplasmic protein DctP, partial [Dissostichus eleginoides]
HLGQRHLRSFNSQQIHSDHGELSRLMPSDASVLQPALGTFLQISRDKWECPSRGRRDPRCPLAVSPRSVLLTPLCTSITARCSEVLQRDAVGMSARASLSPAAATS